MKILTNSQQYDKLIISHWDFIVFKNSITCSISWGACKEVYQAVNELWLEEIYMLEVLEYPELKYYIADQTWVQHESPQLLIFRKWQPIAHASHYDITKDWIKNHI